MSDLFGLDGRQLVERAELTPAFRARVNSAYRLIEALDFEVELFANPVRGRLRRHRGYQAVQTIPGVGPTLAVPVVALPGGGGGRA